MDQFTAQYHLPGLFEFYALYRLFLPLFFEHREYFYDWCGIGSIYGAPEGCLWGGGRVGCGDCDPRDALALLRDYGISARLTFTNSLLRPEHLADPRCNTLCRLFESSGEERNHCPFRPAGRACAAALSGAVSRFVHDKGPDGLLCVPSGAGAAGVSVCRAGFPPESGAGAAACPLAAGEGEGRIPVQRMLPLRLPGPPRVL